ncbi:MAG: hypothetical protein KAU21_18720, partial [Gammaproteobacteria bacterium]|nr:hypothetical protein [Gammaproteobacteria bacterium]
KNKKIKENKASAEVLGISYEELGLGVAKAWHLPLPITKSMKTINSSNIKKPDTENEKNLQLANFSNDLCDIIQNTPTDAIETSIKGLLNKFSKSIDLTPKQLNSYISKAIDHVHEYANIFNLKVKESTFMKNIEYWVSDEPKVNTDTAKADDEKSEAKIVATSSESGARNINLLNSAQEISDSILDGASLNEVMVMVIETLYSGFDFTRVIFCMINRKNATVDARFGFGKDIDELLKTFNVPIRREADIFNMALTKQQDYVIDNIDDPEIKDLIPDWYRKKMMTKSLILYPVVINKVPMGFIYADNTKPTQLSKNEQISIIKTLRNQIIFAIRQNSN